MNKCICDFCGENEASRHFKMKERKWVPTPHGNVLCYVKVDICQECYYKILNECSKNAHRKKRGFDE